MDKQQIGAHVIALAGAFALAIPIGWDREKKERSAGLRTFPLVALASYRVPAYPADALPPELAAIPAIKPGSRGLA